MERQRASLPIVGGLLALIVPLAVYLVTLAREITFIDSGELAAVAARLGIAHPPGYPLFTLLGHLFSWLPVGTVAFRVGLASALPAALTALAVYVTGATLLRIAFPNRPSPAMTLAPLAGAWLYAFARTPWSQAVVVEVYALQALLVMAFLAVCAHAWRYPQGAVRSWPLAGFALGLALTNHLTGTLLFPGLLLFLLASLAARRRANPPVPIPWLPSLICAALPLLLYLYLPLRSRMQPAPCWDLLDSWQRFWVHVTARQYHGNLGRRGFRLEEIERFLGHQLPAEATALFVALAVVGLLVLLWRSRMIAGLSLTCTAAFLLYNAAYPIHDIQLYYGTTLVIFGLWAAVGAGVLVIPFGHRYRVIGFVLVCALGLSCGFPLHAHWRENDQRTFRLVADYVQDALRGTEPGAVVFTNRWDSFGSPALYYQLVENQRPDVTVLEIGSLGGASLQRRLERATPDLAAACKIELESMAEIARKAERGESYDLVDARVRYSKLKRRLVEHSLELRPTYATPELTGNPMFARLHFIAEGLLARVRREDEFVPFTLPPFAGPGITLEETRNEQEQILFVEYSRMLFARARYLSRHGRQIEADALKLRAAALAPRMGPPGSGLGVGQ